jgi:lipoprotein-releasing system permease protein
MPGVAAVSPMVSAAGLALRGEATKAIALVGVELDRYDRIVQLREKVVAGTARLGPGEAIIGASWRPTTWACGRRPLRIVTGGVSDSCASRRWSTSACASSTGAPSIVPLRRRRAWSACPAARPAWTCGWTTSGRRRAGRCDWRRSWPYRVESWQQANAQLVSALNAQSVSTAIIRAVVMIVVVLGIASVLVVSVVQKQREIGILRAMGATQGRCCASSCCRARSSARWARCSACCWRWR